MSEAVSRVQPKWIPLAVVFPVILFLDVLTKRWALETLADGRSLELWGGLVPLTLAFNRGAAFSLHVGDASRWVFLVLSLVALVVLWSVYRAARANDFLRLFSLSLVAAGAVGNLIDRVRWDRGVVDFIGPIDLGFMSWPIFNVADMAISCGAVMLAFSLYREGREQELAAESASERAPA